MFLKSNASRKDKNIASRSWMVSSKPAISYLFEAYETLENKKIELFLCLTYQRIIFIFGFFSDSSSDVRESVSHDSVEFEKYGQKQDLSKGVAVIFDLFSGNQFFCLRRRRYFKKSDFFYFEKVAWQGHP